MCKTIARYNHLVHRGGLLGSPEMLIESNPLKGGHFTRSSKCAVNATAFGYRISRNNPNIKQYFKYIIKSFSALKSHDSAEE